MITIFTDLFACSMEQSPSWEANRFSVKKFPVFYGTRKFITALTSVHHLYLSWARSIQPIALHPMSWRSILILASHLHLGLPSGPSLRFPHHNPVYNSSLQHTRYIPGSSQSSGFDHPNNIWSRYRSLSSSLCNFSIPLLPRPS